MTPEEIKNLRNKLGLSQKQFAKQLGVSKRTVAYWENGRICPGKDMQDNLVKLQVNNDESVKSGEEVKSESVKSGEEVKSEQDTKNVTNQTDGSVDNNLEVDNQETDIPEDSNPEDEPKREHNRKSLKRRSPFVQKYYPQRGIADDTRYKELLGYAPDNNDVVKEMLKTYKAEQLVSSGLFIAVSDCLEPIYKRRYVMPYWDDGKIVYSIGRLDTDDQNEIAQLPEWNRGKYKKQLVHSEKHPSISKVVKNVLWNADCVNNYSTGSIAEGIIDGILHKQISDEIGVGVLSPVTTKFSSNDIEQLINLTQHWEKVYCIADNEASQAGIKGAVETAKTLFNAGRNPYIVLPPRPDDVEKADLADYLNVPSEQKEARTKEFAQLLSSSPPLLDYLIEQAKAISERGDMHSSPSAKKERNEKITEIIGLMVDPSFSSRQALNPLELEDYKDTLETQLGIKRGVFKSIFEQAKKEKAKSSAQKAQEELNQRTVNVAEGQRSAGTAAGLGSERH